MKIGIPRALLFYKFEKLWTTFFDELGIEYIISPQTNKEIITQGATLAIDETCLPTKILLGHINYLKDKCDIIFLPRIENAYGYRMCTKFLAQTDLVNNTFREDNLKLLFYNIAKTGVKAELKAFKKMGKFLGIKRSQIKYAYFTAKQAQMYYEMFREQNQETILNESKKKKVLIIAHAYNIGDEFVGKPVINILKQLNCEPIMAEYCNANSCIKASNNITKTMPWAYNRHLVGALELVKDKIDGVIILTTFPCGPDSMVNELVIHKLKNIPTITLTIDAQDATAGIETRLESFVDILNFKKESENER